jgi:low-density lipoprotein receptor-related protein 1 (alpha-2-macroglobulin receptor)
LDVNDSVCNSQMPSVVLDVVLPAVAPVLLVSNRYYLRNITVDGGTVDLLASDLQNAVALDFDWAEQYIYWSDVMSSGSNISRMKFDLSNREVNQ